MKSEIRNPKFKIGFLLLEVMVAISLLSVGLVLVLRTFSTSLQTLRTSQNYTQAVLRLEEKVWELEEKAREFEILPAERDGTFGDEDEKFKWELQTTKLEDIVLHEATLLVRWQEGRRGKSVSLVTYLENKEE